MGKALYRKYRSKNLSEIIGQEHITTTLSHALQSGKISHAYLFTGPRGSGKTSLARIIAHEVNGLPYDDENHLDIIEIDAASNRRIDEIRDLRDKVFIAPTSATYKVYIIDEVHMLTREAFNALLKTLEEPPEHAIFILATTEIQKVPDTIQSRTQRFTLRPVELPKVVEHLRSLASQEKIDIEDAALELIAAHGEGSFRDSISLLDQARNQTGNVTAEHVRSMLGIPPEEAVSALITTIAAADAAGVVQQIGELETSGFTGPQTAKALGRALREQLLDGKPSINGDRILSILTDLLEVPVALRPMQALEIALLKPCFEGAASMGSIASPTPVASPAVATPAASKPIVASQPTVSAPTPPKPVSKPDQIADLGQGGGHFDAARWPDVLNDIKRTHNTLYGITRMATPVVTPQGLTLYFKFAFHQKRVNEVTNRQIIQATIQKLTGEDVLLTCEFGEPETTEESISPSAATSSIDSKPIETPQPTTIAPEVGAIADIFGGAEIL